MSACANSSRRSATFSRYSLATSAFSDETMWESSPDDVALPGLALRTPEPDRTPDAVCEAIPDVEGAPSLELKVPNFLGVTL